MTTIAWDGQVLAADTQIRGGSFVRRAEKLFTIKSGVYFGSCGSREDSLVVANWLQNPQEEKPRIDEDFAGILIEHGRCYRLEQKLQKDLIKEKHHSVGSGAAHAIVAMYLGQGAVEAIQTAAVFDENTSFNTTFIDTRKLTAA